MVDLAERVQKNVTREQMATAPVRLSLEEFHSRYAGEKPYYEYWFGEAVQKSVGTLSHGILQLIVGELLRRAGYKVAAELELRIDPQWEPVPDVAAWLRRIAGRYPTEPIDVVVEILSPEDRMSHVMSKCGHYERIGIQQIFVLDPEEKKGWQWSKGSLESVTVLHLKNGNAIDLTEVWKRLDEES